MPSTDTQRLDLVGAPGEPGLVALRAALALALLTQRPFSMRWAADGEPPGPAALEALRAAAMLGGKGAQPDPHTVSFTPAPLRAGTYAFETAEAVAPLVPMLALPLALAGGPSTLRLTGPTHGPGAATFHDLALGWLPLVEAHGLGCELALEGAGFAPDPGLVTVRIYPAPRLNPVERAARGMLQEVRAVALVANLGIGLAVTLQRRASEKLRSLGIAPSVEALPMPAAKSRGLAVMVLAQFERARACIVISGEAGKRAEALADEAVAELASVLERRGAVLGTRAPELLLPAAVAASAFGAPGAIGQGTRGPSRFTLTEVRPELLTTAHVVRAFLDVDVQVAGMPGSEGAVEVRPRA